MRYTIRNLLETSPFSEAQVIAGRDGLDNEIQYAGILDAPDSIRFVREGELLMTSGYIFTANSTTLIEVINELHERKAAALGIKIFRYIQSFSDEARALADEYKLPILFIPNKFSWHDLLLPIMLNISIENEDNTSQIGVYDQLVQSIRQSQTVMDTLARAGELLQYPMTLVNEETLLKMSYPADFEPPVEIDEAFLAQTYAQDKTSLASGNVEYYQHKPSQTNFLAAGLKTEDFQTLILWNCPTPESQKSFNYIVYSLILVKEAIQNQQSEQRNQLHRKNALLNKLLTASNNELPSLLREASSIQINTDIDYSPAVCRMGDKKSAFGRNAKLSIFNPAVIKLFDRLSRKHKIPSCVDEHGLLHFLLPIPEEAESSYDAVRITRKMGAQIRNILRELFPETKAQLLIGSRVQDWNNMNAKHRETMNTLSLLKAEHQFGSVVHIHDIGATRLLYRPELAPFLEEFYQEYFSPILDLGEDVQNRIFQTINIYVETGFNFRETSRILDVHHNTVRNRLEQFTDATGLSITNQEDLMIILICLRLKNPSRQKAAPAPDVPDETPV